MLMEAVRLLSRLISLTDDILDTLLMTDSRLESLADLPFALFLEEGVTLLRFNLAMNFVSRLFFVVVSGSSSLPMVFSWSKLFDVLSHAFPSSSESLEDRWN